MISNQSDKRGEMEEKYLFDTDTITNILKRKPSEKLVARLGTLRKSQQHITTTTVAEIVYGAYKSSKPSFHIERLEKILMPAVNILSFDSKSSYICGRLRAELEKTGQCLSLADLEIASIALADDMILISGNLKHFKRIKPLNVENWI